MELAGHEIIQCIAVVGRGLQRHNVAFGIDALFILDLHRAVFDVGIHVDADIEERVNRHVLPRGKDVGVVLAEGVAAGVHPAVEMVAVQGRGRGGDLTVARSGLQRAGPDRNHRKVNVVCGGGKLLEAHRDIQVGAIHGKGNGVFRGRIIRGDARDRVDHVTAVRGHGQRYDVVLIIGAGRQGRRASLAHAERNVGRVQRAHPNVAGGHAEFVAAVGDAVPFHRKSGSFHILAVFIDGTAPAHGRRGQGDLGARCERGQIRGHLKAVDAIRVVGLVDVDEVLSVLLEHRVPLAVPRQDRLIGAGMGVLAGFVVHPPHKGVAAVGHGLQGDGLPHVIRGRLCDPGVAGIQTGIDVDVHFAGFGRRLVCALLLRLRRFFLRRGLFRDVGGLRRLFRRGLGALRRGLRKGGGREQRCKHEQGQQKCEDPFFHIQFSFPLLIY